VEITIKDEGEVDLGKKKGLRNHRFVLTVLIQPGDSIVKIADKISAQFNINCSPKLLLELAIVFAVCPNLFLVFK
jgi:hypothetical protein